MSVGSYNVIMNSKDTGLQIEVRNQQKRNSKRIGPYTPLANAELIESLAQQNVTIHLNPGLWEFDRTLMLPPGTTIIGHGATLRWKWATPWNGTTYHQRCMVWFGDLHLEGITFDLSTGGMLTWNDFNVPVVFDQCTFIDGTLGHWGQNNSVVMRSKFIRASAGSVSGGTWVLNDWNGVCYNGHAFSAEKGDNLIVVGARFYNTDRGIILRTGWGSHIESYFSHLLMTGQSDVDNGNELFATEAIPSALPFVGVMVYKMRAYNTEGVINLWEGNLVKWKMIDVVLDGSSLLAPCYNGGLFDSVLERWEVRRGFIEIGETSVRNKLVWVNVVNPAPSRQNQFTQDHKPYDPAKLAGIRVFRPAGYDPTIDPNANSAVNCSVVGMPAGKDFINIKVSPQ